MENEQIKRVRGSLKNKKNEKHFFVLDSKTYKVNILKRGADAYVEEGMAHIIHICRTNQWI